MQKIYIVFCGVAWEGSYPESIHATREGAEAFKAEFEASRDMRFVDAVTIEEWEVKA